MCVARDLLIEPSGAGGCASSAALTARAMPRPCCRAEPSVVMSGAYSPVFVTRALVDVRARASTAILDRSQQRERVEARTSLA